MGQMTSEARSFSGVIPIVRVESGSAERWQGEQILQLYCVNARQDEKA